MADPTAVDDVLAAMMRLMEMGIDPSAPSLESLLAGTEFADALPAEWPKGINGE